jgi:hypothetical protein
VEGGAVEEQVREAPPLPRPYSPSHGALAASLPYRPYANVASNSRSSAVPLTATMDRSASVQSRP